MPTVKRISSRPDSTGNHQWDVRFYRKGIQVHRRLHLPSRAAVDTWIANFRAAPDTSSLKWSRCATLWADEERHVSEDYRVRVEREVERLVASIGDCPVEETTAESFRDFIRRRVAASGTGAGQHAVAHLKMLARWARSQILIDEIPFEHVRKPRHRATGRKPIDPSRVGKLLSKLGPWERPIATFIALTGCRQQDAAGLRERDIDGNRCHLHVKGGNDPDYILDEILVDVIESARKLKAGHGLRSNFVFTNSVGSRWSAQHLAHRVKHFWQDEPGSPTLHALRHTFATLAGSMFPADVVKAVLAHKSRITSERYTHVADDIAARDRGGRAVRAALIDAMGPDKTNCLVWQDKGTHTIQHNDTKKQKCEVMIEGQKVLIPKEVIDKYRSSNT